MAINFKNDVGAPVVVIAADLLTKNFAPTWNEWLAYIAAVGGYLGAGMNFGGEFIKNIGIASVDWAANRIYDRVKGMSVSAAPVARAAMRPAATAARYSGIAQTTKPGFENVKIY